MMSVKCRVHNEGEFSSEKGLRTMTNMESDYRLRSRVKQREEPVNMRRGSREIHNLKLTG